MNTPYLPTKSPSFLSMEFASLLRRSSRTVTTARAPARRECPGSHEQYLLLLKSTVTRLIRRVPDRKDTLGHGITWFDYHPSNVGWLTSGWLVGPQRG